MLCSCAQTGLLLPAQLLWGLSPLLLWAWPGWGCSSKMVEPRWRGSGREAIYLCKGPLCSLLPRGLECPEIPRFPASGLSVLSCPFKTSRKHSPNQNNNSNNEREKKKKEKMRDFLCPQAPVSGTCSLVLLPCFLSIGVSVPLRLPKSTCQKKKKNCSRFFPSAGIQGEGHSGPAGPVLVSYLLR